MRVTHDIHGNTVTSSEPLSMQALAAQGGEGGGSDPAGFSEPRRCLFQDQINGDSGQSESSNWALNWLPPGESHSRRRIYLSDEKRAGRERTIPGSRDEMSDILETEDSYCLIKKMSCSKRRLGREILRRKGQETSRLPVSVLCPSAVAAVVFLCLLLPPRFANSHQSRIRIASISHRDRMASLHMHTAHQLHTEPQIERAWIPPSHRHRRGSIEHRTENTDRTPNRTENAAH